MFIVIAIIYIICGVMFMSRFLKMEKGQDQRKLIGFGGVLFIFLGLLLIYSVATGKISKPLLF